MKKCIPDNVIYVSRGYDTEKQYGHTIHLDEMHWITLDPWAEDCQSAEIAFKNRHSPEFIAGRLTRIADREYVIESDTRIQGIAPGQFTSIYSPDRRLCYGSGIITGREIKP